MEFYTKALGCRVITHSPFMSVTFMADDVESTARELKQRRVEFVQEPRKADWGTSAIFKDPDGNTFVLSSP